MATIALVPISPRSTRRRFSGTRPTHCSGPKPGWWPGWLPFSPALLILPFPGLFRVTCYYYRGAYYKALWADPPSCTVREPRHSYRGEQSFPLILQNVHRYFMYVALLFLIILAHDVWDALWFTDPATGITRFGIGVGTLVLALNVVLLSSYTFGCHSLRHIVGGYLDRLAGRPVRRTAYACVELFQSVAHAVGLDEPVRCRLRRYLRAHVLHGHLARLAPPLSTPTLCG